MEKVQMITNAAAGKIRYTCVKRSRCSYTKNGRLCAGLPLFSASLMAEFDTLRRDRYDVLHRLAAVMYHRYVIDENYAFNSHVVTLAAHFPDTI